MTALAQRSFAVGELAHSLHARTGLTKSRMGLRQLRNFIVQRHGGIVDPLPLPVLAVILIGLFS
jgi:hypothetical protein